MRLDSANLPPSIAAAHGKPVTLRHSPDCQCPKCSRERQQAGLPARTEPTDGPAPLASEPADKPRKKAPGLSKPRGRKGMNKTEAAFALILEARKRALEIDRYEREGITLRWPDGMTYTADFAVWSPAGLALIETKGAFLREDALVKFRAARAHWPEFAFEMWQLKSKQWSQVL